MNASGRALAALIVSALAAVACTLPPRPPPSVAPSEVPDGFPRAEYERAAAQGQVVHRIDPARSQVVVEVRRGGALARVGHDHVVVARHVQGAVAPTTGRADLYIAPADLVVDEPGPRAAAGFDTRPSAADIAGTRANMLDKVLEAERFPWVLVRVQRRGVERVAATITLRGVTREFEAPVRIVTQADRTLVDGRLAFNQSDFGITPFSILGGAIQVQDRVTLAFTIEAAADPR